MDAQRSTAWFDERSGRITASRICDVMAFTPGEGVWKSGPRKGQAKVAVPLKARTDYIHQLAAERLTGNAKRSARAPAMDWGTEWEPIARQEYENQTGVLAEPCFFVRHPVHDFIGASADFLVGREGGGEMKCPYDQEVHLETLLQGMPKEHVQQVQCGMWVTGRKWWDFVSYHPTYPPHLRLYVQRIDRDDEFIAQIEAACLSLNDEVEAIVKSQLEKASGPRN
jgi:putative phage-type endonuclease